MELPKLPFPEQDENQLKARGVSLVAILDTARTRKDGTSTVKLRIVHNRFPKLYSTKINMSEADYVKMCGCRPKNELQQKKRVVLAFLRRAYNIILDYEEFSFYTFDNAFRSRTVSNNIFSYFDTYIDLLNSDGKVSSAISYYYASKALSDFIGKKVLSFERVNPVFLKAFEKWILSKGNSPTTVGFHSRCIKKVFNDAIRKGDAKQIDYPFGDFKNSLYAPPQPRNIKKALSLADIKLIYSYVAIDGSPEQYYRDIWVFSYLGNGISMKDICCLRHKHIVGDSIHFVRSKTSTTNRNAKLISIALIPELLVIIKKWGNEVVDDNTFIFPVLVGGESPVRERALVQQFTKQVNKYIKRIALKVGVDTKISTYTARHSFATVQKRLGTPIAYISESLGHSSLKTTESYLDSFEDDARREHTRKLLDFDS
jgi:integrase